MLTDDVTLVYTHVHTQCTHVHTCTHTIWLRSRRGAQQESGAFAACGRKKSSNELKVLKKESREKGS